MATEGKHSKGRFLYLFDWNAKSRKKLFSNKSESSEGSNQGKENGDNLVISQYLMREMRENGDHPSFRGSDNYNYESLGNRDDGYEARPPGVVARLMGLDTMPTTTSGEACSVTSYDSVVTSSYYPRGAVPLQQGHHTMDYSYSPNRVDGFSWNTRDSRKSKTNGHPIERFQTEVLPPKSAKPISITHHKLLSPIKSPGFVPSKDAAYIMEAASRIIDPSPLLSGRTKISSVGSPSSSFRIQDLRERMDAAQRSFRPSETPNTPKQSSGVSQMRGSPSDRSTHRSLFRNIMGSQTSSSQKVKSKGKSIPLPAQNKASSQKKDGFASGDSRSRLHKERKKVVAKQKEPNAAKERNTQKAGTSRSSRKRTSGVLQQNSDKQNSVSQRDKSSLKSSVAEQQPRKNASGVNSVRPSKIVNRVFVNAENGSKKVVTTVSSKERPLNCERRPSLNKIKNISRGKLPEKVDDSGRSFPDSKGKRAMQHDHSPHSDSRKDMNVISFTFTSPIKKSGSPSLPAVEAIEAHGNQFYDDTIGNEHLEERSSLAMPLGLKLIDSGSLSRLLEQKLQELTDKIGSTKLSPTVEGLDTDSLSCLSESASLLGLGGTDTLEYDDWCDRDQTSTVFDDDCSSSIITRSSQKFEDSEDIEDHSVIGTNQEVNRESELEHHNISIPECSISGSWVSSTSDLTYGYDQPSSPQSQDVISSFFTEDVVPREDESEFMDGMFYWELEYVRYMLHYAGLNRSILVDDFSIIDPNLFDLLENLINASGRTAEQCSKLDRRILFDCISESVGYKHERAIIGSYKGWVRWGFLLQTDWLTEEVYKEISCWQSMGNLMVDELVDCDMSTQVGKWLDFEIESLEEGMDIEEDIVASLVDELVADLSIQSLSI
ncbi:uncharacterized protein LOC141642803 [Silene latifolia]|uniref:uncharacterized protein LOC141642803 n=1 Tax=Silene latifolia TaxID=37657 RepID=UPI003D779D01